MNHQLIVEELNESPQSPGQLALVLHEGEGIGLEATLPDDWCGTPEVAGLGYVTSSERLTFTSLADRNQILAQHICTRHFSSGTVDRDTLFSVAHNLWTKEIGRTDFASGRLLVEVSKHVDVLHLAADHIRAGANTFDVLHVIESMLVHAQDIKIESLIELARSQHIGTKGDFFAGMLYRSLDNWLATRPQVARDIFHCLADSTDDVAANLIGTAIIGLSRSAPDEATKFSLGAAESAQAFRRRMGYWMCGRILQQSNVSASDRANLEKIILNGIQDADPDIQRESLRAATDALHLTIVFDSALRELAQSEDPDVLAAIESALFMKSSELQEQGRFLSWLPMLVAHAPRDIESMNGLDHALSNLLKSNSANRFIVIEFLTAWTLRHSGDTPIEKAFARCFDQCMYKLAEQPDVLASVITEWLSHEARQLAGATAGLLSELEVHRIHEVHLDPEKLGSMNAEEFMFLAKRLLGFVHSPQQLLSLSLTMLNVDADALRRTIPLLRALIVDEIGYDFPGTTIEALTTAAISESRPDVKLALDEWRQHIESNQNSLEQLPRLNELRPPSQLQRQFVLARSKQMAIAQKEASKGSIFRQIATEIPLKAGRGCFNHMYGQYGEPSSLQTLSYSIELPRREVLDPVGNAIRGVHLRMSKKNTK